MTFSVSLQDFCQIFLLKMFILKDRCFGNFSVAAGFRTVKKVNRIKCASENGPIKHRILATVVLPECLSAEFNEIK